MFPEGRERMRALGLFTAVSIGGGAIGLIAGGMLTEWASWRWVLFVNVPIGLAVSLVGRAGAARDRASARPVRPRRCADLHPRHGRAGLRLRPGRRRRLADAAHLGCVRARRGAAGRVRAHRAAGRAADHAVAAA